MCLPTPMSTSKLQNISILKKVITDIKGLNINATLVIKSTVLPNYLEDINKIYNNFVTIQNF